MTLTSQRNTHYIVSLLDTPPDQAVVEPDFAPTMRSLATETSNPNWDRHKRVFEDQTVIENLLIAPSPSQPSSVSLPSGGSADVTFSAAGTATNIDYSTFELVTATGLDATHRGRGVFNFAVSEAARSAVPSGQAFNVTASVRARDLFGTWHTWNLSVATTGTQAVAVTPGPVVIGQPAPRSFNEGVASTFSVDVASFFSVDAAALPATYTVENADGTTLSGGWTLNAITSGIASITSPSSGATTKTVVYRVTDANGKTASVSIAYQIVANPLPQVVSSITAVSIDISQSGNFPVSGASVIVDPLGETLNYSLRNADGSAPPTGYSYDGTNIAYPTEGGAVTRSFIIRAVETGALGRTVDSNAFTFDRPALPVTVVDPVATVSFPENATTSIDVDVRTALSTDAAEDITIPATFTGKISKSSLGSGVFRLTGTFANNEILSATATYSGTASGSPVTGFPTFKSVHNPPVDGVGSSIDLLTNTSSVLDVVALSDDPSTNLIVAGSAFIDVGQVSISADFLTLTLTPESTSPANATLTYILEAGSGGPQTSVSIAVTWRQVVGPQPLVASISTQSTDGVTPPTYDLTTFWSDGDFQRDVTSVQFYDIDDVALGTSVNVSGAGTMTVSSAGVATFTQVTGFVGLLPYRVGISDTVGTVSILDWSHTQLANPGDPPPPGTLVPNTLDGKPIMQRGIEAHSPLGVGVHILFKNKARNLQWSTDGANSQGHWATNTLSSREKVEQSENDLTTGWFKLAPGERRYLFQPRSWQRSNGTLSSLQTGDWSMTIRVRAGEAMSFGGITGAGWAESGSTLSAGSSSSAIINGGASFTYDERRFTKTLTSGDTSTAAMWIENPAGSGVDMWHCYWWAGRVSDEADWETEPFTSEGILDLAEDKVIRIMDNCSPAGKAAYASEMVSKTDYLLATNAVGWISVGDPNIAGNAYLRQGTNHYMWFKRCAAGGQALWSNVPITFGMGVTKDDANGFWTGAATADPFSTNPTTAALAQAYADVISTNFDSIIAAAKVQYRSWAQARVQEAIDAGYPDNYTWYLEVANEIWGGNNFPVPNRYAKAVTDHLRGRTDGKPTYNKSTAYGGAGYIANLIATEVLQVISEMKPNQKVQFVLGIQTNGSTGNATSWADGWNVFSQEFPTRSTPIDKFGFATTNYLSNAFKWTGTKSIGPGSPFNVGTAQEYYDAFNAAAAVSEDNLFQIIYNWFVTQGSTGSSGTGTIDKIQTLVAACEGAGMTYIGNYEGWFHEDPPNADITGIPGLLTYRNNFRDGPYGEALINWFIQAFTAIWPDKIIANYYKYVRDDFLLTSGSSWFEIPITQFGVTPTAGFAKAIYDNSRKGAGAVTPPTNLDQDFETGTTQTLISLGWTFGSFDLFDNGFGDRSLYSTNEFDTAQQTLGSTLQANAIRSVRLVMRPDGTRTAEYGRLIMSSTGDYVSLKPGASGALVVTYLGQAAANAVTTTGLDLLDGNAHDLTITYYAHASSGLIEVKRTSDDFVYGTFSGDTISTVTSGASPHIDRIELRGKVYWGRVANLTGVTPPTPVDPEDTLITLDHAAGSQAGLPIRLTSSDFTGGAAHDFFVNAQADGGDIRVYLTDGTTRLPVHVVSFNKTAGTCDIRFRDASARAQNYTWRLRSGGDGTLTQPAADATYGSQAVYADFDLYTTDMTVNHVDGEVFGLQGGAQTFGPNGLVARGYDSQGVNAGDASTSTLTTNDTAISCGLFFNRAAKGGGGVGISDTGFARLFHMQNGDDVYIVDSNGALVVDREFSTTDATWYTTYGTKNTWAVFCYSHDGSTGNPTFTLNEANAAVSVLSAPAGTLVPGDTTLIMGNHNGFNRNFDGQICEYWRKSTTTSQAYHLCWQTNMNSPASFLTVAGSGSSTYTPELQAVLAQMTTQPNATRAQLYDDEIVIPLKAAGVWDKLDLLYILGVHDAQAALVNWITPASFALTGTASPTFTTDRGFNYDGSTQWHATGFTPSSSGTNFLLNSASMGVWSRGTGQSTNGAIGAKVTSGGTTTGLVNPRTGSDLFATRMNDATSLTNSNTDASGFYAVSREGASLKRMYKNGAQVGGDATTASTALADNDILVGGVGGATDTSYAGDLFAAFAGGALTASDMAALYSALDSYKTAVGA